VTAELGSTRRSAPILGFALAVAAVVVLAGCGDGSREETKAGDDGRGALLYRQSCASCHGTDLRGTAEGPSHLSQVYEPSHHSDDSFRAAITQGTRAHHWNFGDMAPVRGLDDDEVDAIIAYVRAQQEAQGFEPYPPR
jgi:mono/diheme cytochrome c family protein